MSATFDNDIGSLGRFRDPDRNAVLSKFCADLHSIVVPRFNWFVYSDKRSPAGMIRGKPTGNPPRNTLTVCPITALYICRENDLPYSVNLIEIAESIGVGNIMIDLVYAIDEEPYCDLGMYIQSALGLRKKF